METEPEDHEKSIRKQDRLQEQLVSPAVLCRVEPQNMGLTTLRRNCSFNNLQIGQAVQKQSSKESASSDELMSNYPRLKPSPRSRSIDILVETDSSECSQCATPLNSSQEDLPSKPEDLIVRLKPCQLCSSIEILLETDTSTEHDPELSTFPSWYNLYT